MGLGPSTKMTSLHHFNCPVTRHLLKDKEVDFCGVVVDGVSENYDNKLYTAKRTAELIKGLEADGALVAIDGWGNHHLDFVAIIDFLGEMRIASVGLSYLGTQGKLVATSPHVKKIVDFNKSESGFESCVVGENNLNEQDALIATAILKNRLKKSKKGPVQEELVDKLQRFILQVKKVEFGSESSWEQGKLTIEKDLTKKLLSSSQYIEDVNLKIISPSQKSERINSILDFMPIAAKVDSPMRGRQIKLLDGLCLMLTGVEKNGFQPSNIGASNGILKEQVVFDQAGTPKATDYLLNLDVTFKDGEGRTARGIEEAHCLADQLANNIRQSVKDIPPDQVDHIPYIRRRGAYKVALVKIVSGLGNMYDTIMFPSQPAGVLGGRQIRDFANMPSLLSPLDVLEGKIHSLL